MEDKNIKELAALKFMVVREIIKILIKIEAGTAFEEEFIYFLSLIDTYHKLLKQTSKFSNVF